MIADCGLRIADCKMQKESQLRVSPLACLPVSRLKNKRENWQTGELANELTGEPVNGPIDQPPSKGGKI